MKQTTIIFIFSILILNVSAQKNKTAESLNLLGISHFDSANYGAAINSFTKAISIDSTNPEYFSNRALCRYEMKNYGEALKDIDKAIKLKGTYPGLYYIRGLIMTKTGEREAAKKDFTKEVIYNPGCFKCYYNLGSMYYEDKEDEVSLKMFDKAINAKSDYADAYNSRAVLKYRLKDRTGACADWKKALELGHKEASKDFSRFCNQ